ASPRPPSWSIPEVKSAKMTGAGQKCNYCMERGRIHATEKPSLPSSFFSAGRVGPRLRRRRGARRRAAPALPTVRLTGSLPGRDAGGSGRPVFARLGVPQRGDGGSADLRGGPGPRGGGRRRRLGARARRAAALGRARQAAIAAVGLHFLRQPLSVE